jgi:hypothetical protein
MRATPPALGASDFAYAIPCRACYASADLNWSTPRKGRRFIFMKSAVSLSRNNQRREAALLLAVLMCCATVLWGQNSPGSNSAHPAVSLADYLTGPGNVEHHIFYVHGIGAGGPNDNDSQLLRISICKLLGDCTTKKGELEGTDYADKHSFENQYGRAPLPAALRMSGTPRRRTWITGNSLVRTARLSMSTR